MIVRIVKMTFREGAAETFKELFSETKNNIRDARGCIFLELLQDAKDSNLFMTYSVWHSEADLDRYRHSELFSEIWPKTKALFAADPEVHTMVRIEKA